MNRALDEVKHCLHEADNQTLRVLTLARPESIREAAELDQRLCDEPQEGVTTVVLSFASETSKKMSASITMPFLECIDENTSYEHSLSIAAMRADGTS